MIPVRRLAVHLRDFILRRPLPQSRPYRLWVDITSRCNLKCKACPQRLLEDQDRRDMDPGLLESLVTQVKNSQGAIGQVNLFHRGEPLLHPEFPLWARRFKTAGAVVRVHSNATLLNEERVTGLLEAAPDILSCSVDTLSPADYASARPGADLDKTISGLELLLSRRKELSRDFPKISLLLMGDQTWGPEGKARLQRLRNLGLDRVIRRAPHNWAGAVAGLNNNAKSKATSVCTFPWYALAVLSSGVVTPCPQDFFGQIALGDANANTLDEIWRNSPAQSLRRAHGGHNLSAYPICHTCDRIHRPTILGLPMEHLKNFLQESIVRSS